MHTAPRALGHPELRETASIVRDPVWGDVPLSSRAKSLIELNVFQELRHVSQVYHKQLVFPGVNYSTFSHSIGVYCLAKMLVDRMARREAARFPLEFGVEAVTVLPKPGEHPELRNRTDLRRLRNEIVDKSLDLFFCAALLHDVGKYPFSRTLRELKQEIERERGDEAKALLGNFVPGRERSAQFILDGEKGEPSNGIWRRLQKGWNLHEVHIKRIANIVGGTHAGHYTYPNRATDDIDRLYYEHDVMFSRMLHGPVGLNELDYLMRDSFYTRKQSSLDVERLFSNLVYRLPHDLKPARSQADPPPTRMNTRLDIQTEELITGVLSRGRFEMETFFGLRNLLYKQVYWFSPIRVLDVMIKILLKKIMEVHGFDLGIVEHQYAVGDEDINRVQSVLAKHRWELGDSVGERAERELVIHRIMAVCGTELANRYNVTNERLLDFVAAEIDRIAPKPPRRDDDGKEAEQPPLQELLSAVKLWEVYEEIAFCRDIAIQKGKSIEAVSAWIREEVESRVLEKTRGLKPKNRKDVEMQFKRQWREYSLVLDVKELSFDDDQYREGLDDFVVLFPGKNTGDRNVVNWEPYLRIAPFSNDAIQDLEKERRVLRFHCHSRLVRHDTLGEFISAALVEVLRSKGIANRGDYLDDREREPLVVRVR